MSLAQHVLSAGPHHARLLASIAETDYALPALQQQSNYIEDLRSELARCEKQIATLEQKTKKERAEHEDMRDSTVRKFAHKITGQGGKFKAKASKEER
jgi:Skp family chaperone for outer membrane proteins